MLNSADAMSKKADEARLIPTESIADVRSKWVTIWKTILSLFGVVGANGFEGVGVLRRLVEGWRMVCRVNRK